MRLMKKYKSQRSLKKRRKKAATAEAEVEIEEEEDFEEKEPELGEEPLVLSDKNADDDDIDGDLKDHLPDGIEGDLTIVDDKEEIQSMLSLDLFMVIR